MKTLLILFLIGAVVTRNVSRAQNVTLIYSADRTASASSTTNGPPIDQSFSSSNIEGPFQAEASTASSYGIDSSAAASQNSDITLTGNTTTILGNGDAACNGPYSYNFGSYGSSIINIGLTNSLYYSLQASVAGPANDDVTYSGGYYVVLYDDVVGPICGVGQSPFQVSYDTYYGPLSTNVSGYLPHLTGLQATAAAATQWSEQLLSISDGFSFVLTVSQTPIIFTTISGYVIDAQTSLPIPNASVQMGLLSVLTDANGFYNQSNLPPASYTVIVSATNYISATNTVTTTVSATSATQNFSLQSLGKLDYFGIGVNWANVSDTSVNNLRGDLDAANLDAALQANLPSIIGQASEVVALDATAGTANNLNTILTQFNQFTLKVCRGDTVLLYIATHGGHSPVVGVTGTQLALGADYKIQYPMVASHIETMLTALPSSTRCIVILEACDAGEVADELANWDPNIAILSASPANGNASSKISVGTGVFTDSLIQLLYAGIFDLGDITTDIGADSINGQPLYANLVGQTLNLEDSGSNIFTGLQPQLWTGNGFTGNLASNTPYAISSPPQFSQVNSITNTFLVTLTNVPASGSVAVEMSTNLMSWLQVAFDSAQGTNITFTFPTTNSSAAFFKAQVVP